MNGIECHHNLYSPACGWSHGGDAGYKCNRLILLFEPAPVFVNAIVRLWKALKSLPVGDADQGASQHIGDEAVKPLLGVFVER